MPATSEIRSTLPELGELLKEARLGVHTAAGAIHQEFVDELVLLAKRRINQRFRSKFTSEEIVQSAFASFFRRNQNEEYSCDDWSDLWALLAKITIHKCINHANAFSTGKRNINREVANVQGSRASSFFGCDGQPTAHDIAIFNESLDKLFDRLSEPLQRIVSLRLQGLSNFEISESLNCSERTVYRSLSRIRKTFLEMENDDMQRA